MLHFPYYKLKLGISYYFVFSPAVLGKTLYGLSAVLRNFPEAQNYFLRNGGLDVFKGLFKHEGKLYEKLKIKMITLIQVRWFLRNWEHKHFEIS